VGGRLVYILDQNTGLRVVDISNLAAPREVGAYVTTGTSHALVLLGNLIYLAAGFDGLVILRYVPPVPRVWLPLVVRN
jgi:hypothetical protein